jgi:hypothetical protein
MSMKPNVKLNAIELTPAELDSVTGGSVTSANAIGNMQAINARALANNIAMAKLQAQLALIGKLAGR